MAVTAVYIRLSHVFRGDNKITLDAPVLFSNIAATTAAFTLSGGTYQLVVVGATFGTVTLQVLASDGTTWLTAQTAFAANGTSSANLGAGSYRFALA